VSVRIAHESILGVAYHVARERMPGMGGGPSKTPDPAVEEALIWDDLIAPGQRAPPHRDQCRGRRRLCGHLVGG
jgi:hypothetical protein